MSEQMDHLTRLVGRRSLDGYWDSAPADHAQIELALATPERRDFYLRIREDAVEAYRVAREVIQDSDGSLPRPVNLSAELRSHRTRLEDLYQGEPASFTVRSERAPRFVMDRDGRPVIGYDGKPIQGAPIHKNHGVQIGRGEAMPVSFRQAVSLLTRYSTILEPCEEPKREAVKIKDDKKAK